MFRRMWKAVETKIGKVGIVEAKGGREERRRRKKMGRKRREEENKKEKGKETKKDGSMENSKRMGDLG